ncbi:MAG: LacI family DNA-binding transcriptional regulator [Pseudomonadota bacterium]
MNIAVSETRRRATINDVAEAAGVSIKTVSRVLNHEPKVRPSTRQRVEEAMRDLGYRPNSPARMLAGNRTYLLGLIYNASSSYITSIQNGVLDACRGEHYDLLIHPCSYTDPDLLEQIREFVDGPRVDGLVLVPPVSDVEAVRELLNELGVLYVAISRDSVTEPDWTVCTNDREICAEMVRQLSRLGHERIAFIKGHPDHKAMANRYLGFLDGMAACDLGVDDTLVLQGENTFESGIDCAQRLLRLKPRPTAIFCANDHMATGVLKVAHERRLAVPGALSVAGFDDIPVAAQIWPQLTTIRQPLEEMAMLAASRLIRLLRGEGPAELSHTVPAKLVIRQSTGPAPVDG